MQTRTVATRSASASAPGLAIVVLQLSHAYAALAEARGGFSASVELSFAAPGRPTLRQSVAVTFARPPRARPHKRSSGKRARHAKGHGR